MSAIEPTVNLLSPVAVRPENIVDCIHTIFQACPVHWFSFHEIKCQTKATDKALSWGLIYLRKLGFIETSSGFDVGIIRSSRYRLSVKVTTKADVAP